MAVVGIMVVIGFLHCLVIKGLIFCHVIRLFCHYIMWQPKRWPLWSYLVTHILGCLHVTFFILKNWYREKCNFFSVCMELYGKSIFFSMILRNMASCRNVISMFGELFVPRYHSFFVFMPELLMFQFHITCMEVRVALKNRNVKPVKVQCAISFTTVRHAAHTTIATGTLNSAARLLGMLQSSR